MWFISNAAPHSNEHRLQNWWKPRHVMWPLGFIWLPRNAKLSVMSWRHYRRLNSRQHSLRNKLIIFIFYWENCFIVWNTPFSHFPRSHAKLPYFSCSESAPWFNCTQCRPRGESTIWQIYPGSPVQIKCDSVMRGLFSQGDALFSRSGRVLSVTMYPHTHITIVKTKQVSNAQ